MAQMASLFPGVALVTGAASGIGQAVAAAFAAEGCTRIAICDISLEGLNETAKQLNATKTAEFVEIEIVKVDVSNSSAVHSMIAQIVARWGRVDYVVNSAGIQGPSLRSTDLDPADFDIINDINYRGLWLCSRARLSQMLKQEISPSHDGRPGARGSIVHIASQLGLVARTVAPAYSASKAAVISLARSDAIDVSICIHHKFGTHATCAQYSRDSIRVNCVCPGLVATDKNAERSTPMTGRSDETRALFAPAVAIAPMNRMGEAREIADACLFLCSSKASFVQGTALVSDVA
ncbi:NAD(P)-binding protein [Aureobasidium pullulans]|nr:NAD(P)-binding protein [Aureobasidium pullulans]THZ94886.1 NAD(P)-binding protein [Aureobasidium pullulans]